MTTAALTVRLTVHCTGRSPDGSPCRDVIGEMTPDGFYKRMSNGHGGRHRHEQLIFAGLVRCPNGHVTEINGHVIVAATEFGKVRS